MLYMLPGWVVIRMCNMNLLNRGVFLIPDVSSVFLKSTNRSGLWDYHTSSVSQKRIGEAFLCYKRHRGIRINSKKAALFNGFVSGIWGTPYTILQV